MNRSGCSFRLGSCVSIFVKEPKIIRQGEFSMAKTGAEWDGRLKEKRDEKLKEPDMFRVVLHNDDYTTQEFVVEVLVKVFHKSVVEATRIMLNVHRHGTGQVGVFTYDIAATKVRQVTQMAREREFPLKCSMEKA